VFTSSRKRAALHPAGPGGPSPRQRAGAAAEQRALDHLLAQGLRLVARNYRADHRSVRGAGRGRAAGEIDLILRDGPTLVFVEVRARSGASHGGAAASVTAAKRAKLLRAAQFYLQSLPAGTPWPPCRFDVVAIDGDALQWLRAAFDADG
jgi:putative endonuclease